METQDTLESRVLDAPKRKGPLEGPIHQILNSQDRTEENIARMTAALTKIGELLEAPPRTRLGRLVRRLGL